MNLIDRSALVARIRDLHRTYPVVALLGVRQVGKTTLAAIYAKRFKGPTCRFDLEDARDLRQLDDPYLALEPRRGLIVLDEIQRSPDLFPALRVLSDRAERPARFLVLGSASPTLLRQSSESLAGRVAFVELPGFSIAETGVDRWERLWLRGGMPRSFLARTERESFDWRRNMVETYLERELPALDVSIAPPTIRRFWTMLAHYHGQTWNGAELARSFGVSEKTVKSYLDLLCATYLAQRLTPWHANPGKREVKSPKVFLTDSGIVHALLGVASADELLGHPKAGASFEGFAIRQITDRLGARPEECHSWGIHGGSSLDLLVVRGRRRLGFEMKLNSAPDYTTSARHAKELLRLDSLDIVHAGDRTWPVADGVRALSIRDIWTSLAPIP
jgi:predicted AAA+ superfamily ATPase